MRLNITDFAKIKNADIIVDGITVIAGENNTGKSTIGKILFSIFNSVSNIEDKIEKQRIKEIEETIMMSIHNYIRLTSNDIILNNISLASVKISEDVSKLQEQEDVQDQKDVYDKTYNIIESAIESLLLTETQSYKYHVLVDDITEKVFEIFRLSKEKITRELISLHFRDVFHRQINSLAEPKSIAELKLYIKGRTVEFSFSQNQCKKFASEVSIMHKAIYIDNPFIVEKLTGNGDLNPMDKFLKDLLIGSKTSDNMEGIIGKLLAKEKLEEITKTLEKVIDGEIVIEKSDEHYLSEKGINTPVSFNNLSTGMKSFVILKMLIENGMVKEKDVLVLDEPEIHLHPQWQVVYAELIVLLQKHFDLTIIITTHSPYFLDAINLFSIKYGIDKKVNFYLSSMENTGVEINRVTDNIDLIYKKMASPIQMLDTLRYELNNN